MKSRRALHDFRPSLRYPVLTNSREERVSATEDTIIEFLRSKAEAAWQEHRPYLLSFAAPDMAEAEIDYRSVLNGERLKAFVERTEGEGRYRLVKHPHQRAKIGIVQPDNAFEFETDDRDEMLAPQVKGSFPAHGSVLLDFLNALAKLPPKYIENVVIPIQVLVELAKKR